MTVDVNLLAERVPEKQAEEAEEVVSEQRQPDNSGDGTPFEGAQSSLAPSAPPLPPPPEPEFVTPLQPPSTTATSTVVTQQDQSEKQQLEETQQQQQQDEQQASQKQIQPKQQQTLKVPELRKRSSVSFKDVCELFEIDLEALNRRQHVVKPPAVFSLRYYVMMLALVSPFVVTYSKTIINFAIIDMIEPDFLRQQPTVAGEATTTTTTTTTSSLLMPNLNGTDFVDFLETSTSTEPSSEPAAYFDLDNSCPVDEITRTRLQEELEIDHQRASESTGEKFEWDTVRQGLLKAAYSIGHMLLQVAGGRLSEIHGSHLVMGLSSALIGVACLSAPFLASAHFYLLFADLFFLGLLGSFMTPALITLFSNWLTPSEKSMMLSLYLVSSRLGYALSALLCGLLIQAQLSWRYLFYSAGYISLVFSVLSFICSRSRPHEHPLMKQAELDYLASKNTLVREALAKVEAEAKARSKCIEMGVKSSNGSEQQSNGEKSLDATSNGIKSEHKEKAPGAPWLAIMTNVPVWAFIITKFCVKLAGDTVQIELPTYLKRVMHLAPRHNGLVNASNYVIFCVSCLLVGALAKTANKRRPCGWSKTFIRKLFQVTASFGSGLALLGISLSVCHETSTLILLMLMFFFTTFGTGGEAQIPLDISERYAGTIHAIGSSLAVSGAIEPILVGYILRNNPASRDRWAAVWMGASSVAFLGGLMFLLLGDASIQPFDKMAATSSNTNGDTKDCDTASNGDKVPGKKSSAQLGKLKGQVNETFQMTDEVDDKVAVSDGRSFKESAQI